jgi:hypothetical protein
MIASADPTVIPEASTVISYHLFGYHFLQQTHVWKFLSLIETLFMALNIECPFFIIFFYGVVK